MEFEDKGEIVRIVIPGAYKNDKQIEVNSTTTSLIVKDGSSNAILSVPQLAGTVDAAKTEWKLTKNGVEIELHKFGKEKWSSLEAEEVVLDQDNKGDAGNALAARETVKLLFEAVMNGTISEITSLTRQVSPEGLSHVKDGNGRNALHFAAHAGQLETLEFLLDQEGMETNAQDESGETALSLASAASQLEAVKSLLKHGASVNLKNNSAQPLHRAAATGSAEVVNALIDAGAEKEAPSKTGPPLLWAAGSGNVTAVKALVESGVNCNAISSDGCGAVLMAAAAGDGEVVEALLERGADASLAAVGGVTALHAAAEMGDFKLLKSLIQHGANVDAEDCEGSKAIHAAASVGNRELVEYLLPITKPTGSGPWTIDSLIAETSSVSEASPSQDAAQHDGFFDKEKAGVHKRAGNEAFVAKNYSKAEAEYTEAIKYDASDEMLWCNRSGANLRLGKAEQAFNDAQKSRTLKGNYMKAWFREGEAAKALKRWEEAAQAYYEAYTLNPKDDRLAKEFQHAIAEGQKAYQLEKKG